MKKLALFGWSLLMLTPMMGIAATCAPYNDVVYALQANGASGTLTKTQTCNGDNNNGQYSITSDIKVSKAFFSKEIKQASTGTYASPNTITAQTFINSNTSNSALPANDLDTLSLVLYLSSSLSSNSSFSSSIPLYYDNNTVMVKCSVTSANATVTTGAGAVVPATQVTCATDDNSVVLEYSFSQDAAAILLAATSTENGTQVLATTINNYP